MTTAALQEYFDEWQALDDRYSRARLDKFLSEAGKQRVYKAVEADRAALVSRALEGFQGEYKQQRAAMDRNDRARGQAQDVSLSRWANLTNSIDVEARRIKSLIANGAALSDLMREWKDARHSVVLVNGWVLALQENTLRRDQLKELHAEVKQEYEEMRKTPELEKIEARAGKLADAAIMLREDTVKFNSLLAKVFDLSGAGNELDALAAQIKLTFQPNGKILVEWVDAPQTELQRLANPEPSTFVLGG